MNRVEVEWKHLDQEGQTCDRCAQTGAGVAEVVRQLATECGMKGVEIVFTETLLSAAEIEQSNLVLINGVALEEILPEATASESSCCSCSELTGREESCRTIVRFGMVHEALPPQFIREAICRAAKCC
ncbi:MAG: DUF2703 domain-containing protein [Desulfobulbaceae bacterium]|nr:DUF2703 domain-containing protein [Desulfobulbaceae bacterium]